MRDSRDRDGPPPRDHRDYYDDDLEARRGGGRDEANWRREYSEPDRSLASYGGSRGEQYLLGEGKQVDYRDSRDYDRGHGGGGDVRRHYDDDVRGYDDDVRGYDDDVGRHEDSRRRPPPGSKHSRHPSYESDDPDDDDDRYGASRGGKPRRGGGPRGGGGADVSRSADSGTPSSSSGVDDFEIAPVTGPSDPMVKCLIVRDRSGLKRMNPEYMLYLQDGRKKGHEKLLLIARRKQHKSGCS